MLKDAGVTADGRRILEQMKNFGGGRGGAGGGGRRGGPAAVAADSAAGRGDLGSEQ